MSINDNMKREKQKQNKKTKQNKTKQNKTKTNFIHYKFPSLKNDSDLSRRDFATFLFNGRSNQRWPCSSGFGLLSAFIVPVLNLCNIVVIT